MNFVPKMKIAYKSCYQNRKRVSSLIIHLIAYTKLEYQLTTLKAYLLPSQPLK